MKKTNPLKTFNDNNDKRISSFSKSLKKFQGDTLSSQVSSKPEIVNMLNSRMTNPIVKKRNEELFYKANKERQNAVLGEGVSENFQPRIPSSEFNNPIKKNGGVIKSKKK